MCGCNIDEYDVAAYILVVAAYITTQAALAIIYLDMDSTREPKLKKHTKRHKGNLLAFNEETDDLVVGDCQLTELKETTSLIHHDDVLVGDNVDALNSIPVMGSSSTLPSNRQRKRKHSMTGELCDMIIVIKKAIGEVAALETGNKMEVALLESCNEAIEGMAELDEDEKVSAMELFVDNVDRRRMFLVMRESHCRRWIFKKLGRTDF